MGTVHHPPAGYHTVTPYLADETGKIGWAEIGIGGSPIMLSDAFPESGRLGPLALGSTPVAIHLYVEERESEAPGIPNVECAAIRDPARARGGRATSASGPPPRPSRQSPVKITRHRRKRAHSRCRRNGRF